jgi:hypothetical protein
MRKFCYLLLIALSLSTSAAAWDIIPLAVEIIEGMPVGNGHAKVPMRPPVVYLENHTLAFVADHPEYILNIKDEDGIVVYSTVVYSTQTQVVLPSTLSGNYEIKLVLGSWVFTGWIWL